MGLSPSFGLLRGRAVVMLEHEDRPGGAVKSAHDILSGFVHDPCAWFLPLTAPLRRRCARCDRAPGWSIRPSRWRIRSWMAPRLRRTTTWRHPSAAYVAGALRAPRR